MDFFVRQPLVDEKYWAFVSRPIIDDCFVGFVWYVYNKYKNNYRFCQDGTINEVLKVFKRRFIVN